MFSIIKLVIWLAGVITIAYFVLPYFGYEVNTDYFSESQGICREKLNQCQTKLIQGGLEGAKKNCDFQCLDFKSLIKKK